MLAEAARALEFSGHVENPIPPNLIFGVAPEVVKAQHDAMVAQGHVDAALADGSTTRRGIRKDRHSLMTAIVSYPLLAAMTESRNSVQAELEQFVKLRDRVGFQLVDYQGQTVVVAAEGERLHRWRTPELSGLVSLNGRLYRFSD